MIKLFTHTDLDGIGCAYLAKAAFGDEVSIEYCDYNNINQIVLDFINNNDINDYDNIYITDISVDEKTSYQINNYKDAFVLLDHHPTALWLNDYDWCSVRTHDEKGKKTSGTMLFYNYLVENKLIATHLYMHDIVNYVNLYDTWRWVEDFETPYMLPKRLDNILKLIGRDKFLEFLLSKTSVNSYDNVLDIEESRINNLIKKKIDNIKFGEIIDAKDNDRIFGWVYCDE